MHNPAMATKNCCYCTAMPIAGIHFMALCRRLPADFSAVSISQRGHGKTDAPLNGYSIAQYAEDACQAMDAPRLAQGLLLADIQWALLSPKRWLPAFLGGVSHLLLLGTATTADNALLRGLQQEVAELQDPVMRDFVYEFQSSTCVGALAASMSLPRIVDESMQLPARVWKLALQALLTIAQPMKRRT